MKMERLVSSGAAFALALGLAASAHANITTVTYTGTVASGTDGTGVFGVAGANLAGDAFTAVFTVNDSVSDELYSSPNLTNLFGGTQDKNQSPVSAAITIGGQTLAISGSYYGQAWQSTLASGEAELFRQAADVGDNGSVNYDVNLWSKIFSYINPVATVADYNQPESYTVQTGDFGQGSLTDIQTSDATGATVVDVTASLDTTSVTIASVVSAVPEPATWGMLTLGVGMIGFAVRRRNKGLAIAA
jgi:hypothetical protein